MTAVTVLTGADEVRNAVGTHLGTSAWFSLTVDNLAQFTAATGDPDATYLAISLSNMFLPQIVEVHGFAMGINYGTEAVRLVAPLNAGDEVRATVTLVDVSDVKGGIQTRMTIVVETRGETSCVIESLSRWLGEAGSLSDVVVPEADEVPPGRGSLYVFRHRDFRLFFIAASISNGGTWMQLVAVQALLFDLTDSGSWLGFSTVTALVPAVILTPYAGVLADRVSRRTILQITQSVQMTMAFALWLLYITEAVTPWWIIGVGFINGVATGFQTAAWQSFVPLLVPEEDMLAAVRLNSVQFTLARAIGPALGGLVVALGGIGAAIFANAATYLLVIAMLFLVRPRANVTYARAQRVLAGLKQGALYMWRRRPLRLAVLLALAASTFGQALQFIASALAERLYGRSSDGNAGLLTALGIGAVISSALAVLVGDRLSRSRQVIGALALYIAALAILVSTSTFVVAQGAYFLAGIAHLQMAVALNTLVQGSVPDEYRGRATSFYLLGVLAGIPLGTQFLGSLGDVAGFRTALVVDGAAFVLVLVALITSGWWRDLDATPEQIEPVAADQPR